MKFLVGAATDIGLTKDTNQDSLTIKVGKCRGKDVALAILCDGMGGLQKGEVASATTIKRFSDWSLERLPAIVGTDNMFESIQAEWEEILNSLNVEFNEYGKKNRINVGTTVTGILIIDNEYIIVNVGDSRTYQFENDIEQITEDQSLIAREIKMKRLTEEQAKVDPRKNVLLQCIGATSNLEVEYYRGSVCGGQAYLLCSDGFRHMVSDKELYDELKPDAIISEDDINIKLTRLIKLNMEREETDNITAAFIKII